MSTRLGELCNMLSADSEDAFDDVMTLLKPDNMSRDEMSANFEHTVGYDPISYHDKKELTSSVEALRDTDMLTPEQEEYLADKGNVVVDDAYDRFNSKYRSNALNDALTETLADTVGVDYSATEEVVEEAEGCEEEIEENDTEDTYDE